MTRITWKRADVLLWTAQVLLTLLFSFAGVAKLVMPMETLKEPIALPGAFLRLIGIAETLGALGLVLPGLLHIRTALTPMAAAGLVIIMMGATVVTVAGTGIVPALFPLAVGLVAAFVAYGRWRLAPLPGRSRHVEVRTD